jgi:DNA polymerase III alpha subunit (gram-positive type)
MPHSSKISSYAQEKTGLTFCDNQMFHKGLPVTSCSLEQGLQQLIDWLAVRKQALLIAHNCHLFDSYRLLWQCQCSGIAITQFNEAVTGLANTLPYFYRLYPEIANHQLSAINNYLLKVDFNAHNASADVDILQKLCTCNQLSNMHDFTFTVDSVMQCLVHYRTDTADAADENLLSLSVLVDNKVLGKAMAEKVAKSGLKLEHLQLAYRQQGHDGVANLLSEHDTRGCLRMTRSKEVASKLVRFFGVAEK